MIDQTELRPLGMFSNFVVEEMPQHLVAIREGQTDIHDVIRRGLSLLPRKSLNQIHNLDLATLDLKMFERAIVRFGEQPPASVSSLVDEASNLVDQPPGITYEEIILLNPPQDPRTFTSGEVAVTERHFYQSHAEIETYLKGVISSVTASIEGLSQGNTTNEIAGRTIQEKADDLTQVIANTHRSKPQ